jgi:hypothetical protein
LSQPRGQAQFTAQYKVIENLQKGVAQVLEWIAANDGRLDKSPIKEGHRDYYISLDEFRNDACAGLDYKEVARRLKEEGRLVHNKDGLTYQRRDGSQRYDVYCVRVGIGDIGDIGDMPVT